jgi:hypothetical protein
MSAFARTPETPARFDWHKVTKAAHDHLPACACPHADRSVDALTRPMQVREESPPYGEKGE